MLLVAAAGRVDADTLRRVNHAQVASHHILVQLDAADHIGRRSDDDGRWRWLHQDTATGCCCCCCCCCWCRVTQKHVAAAGRFRYRQRRRSQRLQTVHQLLWSHTHNTHTHRFNWSSGQSIRLVTFRLRFESHSGPFASNLAQVANLLHPQVNSASCPQRDGKWVVAYGLRGEGLVWLIGAVICLLAADRGSNCSPALVMDGRMV